MLKISHGNVTSNGNRHGMDDFTMAKTQFFKKQRNVKLIIMCVMPVCKTAGNNKNYNNLYSFTA